MLRGKLLDAVEGEQCLEKCRLLAPECTVVVEDGDALDRRHEFRTAFSANPRDKIQ